LHDELAVLAGDFDAALITGSYLEPTRGTRFSDIDVTVFTSVSADLPAWAALVRTLRGQFPRLRVNVERAAGLTNRSPLAAARMRYEHMLVMGEFPAELNDGPTHEALRRDAQTWAWQVMPIIWHQLTDPDGGISDPVYAAYVAQKFVVDACRYRHLLGGGYTTQAFTVVTSELADLVGDAGAEDGWEAIEVAREMRPPPPDGDGAPYRYLTVAATVVRALAYGLA
jgi:hypothetical protein